MGKCGAFGVDVRPLGSPCPLDWDVSHAGRPSEKACYPPPLLPGAVGGLCDVCFSFSSKPCRSSGKMDLAQVVYSCGGEA